MTKKLVNFKLKETMAGSQSQYVFNSKTIICLFAVDYFCLFVFHCLPDIRIF